MKKLFYHFGKVKGLFGILFLVCILSAGCNSTDKKIADKTDKTDKNDKEPKVIKGDQKDDDPTDTKTAYANAICNCMDQLNLSSKAKKIIIKAGNSDNPSQTVTTELENIDDQGERQKVSSEIAGLKDMGDDPCFKNIDKKYPEFKDADMSTQKKLVSVLEDKCEVAAALYKVGQKGNKGEGMGLGTHK